MPQMDSFAKRLSIDWQRTLGGATSFSFFQSSDPDNLARCTSDFAEQQGAPLYMISLNNLSAYSPYSSLFALLIRRFEQSNLSAEELAASVTDFVPLQQNLCAMLKGERFERSELVLVDDLYFEQQSIEKAIIALVAKLFVEPAIVVVSGWHFASASAIKMLQALVSSELSIPVLVLTSVDTQYALANRQDDEAWEGFLDWLDDTTLLHNVPTSQSPLKVHWQYRDCVKSAELLVAENIAFMAWPEAEVAARLMLETTDLESSLKVRLQLFLAEALLYQGELNTAVTELELLQVFQESLNNTYDKVRLLNLLSVTLVQQQSFEEAMQCSEAALELAGQATNGHLVAQSLFVNFYAHDKSSTPLKLAEFAHLDSELQQYNMDCSRLYALRNYYTYLRFYEDLDSSIALDFTQKAVKLARRIGHRQGIAASYHSKGIIYSYISRYHATFRCFGISSRIREELGEASERVRMYNGTGYFNTLLEKYPEAQEQYLAAYDIARHTGDYSELVVTLYNFAWLYFCTRDYQQACDVLEQLVRICRIRQMTHFPFRNLYDVFSLKGFCHSKLGERARAQQCLERMQGLPFKPSGTGAFLKALLQGALEVVDGRLNKAEEIFEAAPALLGEVVDMDSRLLPQCSTELLEVYSRRGKWEACDSLLNHSLAMCEVLILPRFTEIFNSIKSIIDKRQVFYAKDIDSYKLASIHLNLDDLVRSAKQDTQLRQVQQRLREMQLISRMQSLPERFDSTVDLAVESLKLVCGNFTVQVGMVHHLASDEWEEWAHVGKLLSKEQVDQYLAHVKDNQSTWINNSFSSKGEDGKRATYNSVACLPIFVDEHLYGALTLCNFNSNRYFDRQDQDTLNLISRQLGSQLQQLKHRENLLKMSTTDSLTGLLNRQALLARLEQELVMFEQQAGTYHCSLAYIDLDNFKIVNDLLGHDVGDKVLSAFSALLVDTMRAGDIVARWGGDEFVVVFPSAKHDQAKLTAERLLANLHKKNYFKEQLRAWAEKPELVDNLPDLSCSIGITDCGGVEHNDLNEDWLLKQADRALYRAKAEGKGRVSVMSLSKEFELD
ncbi:diguanylate cyclase [Agarivorans sp. B2Z047]|uniref:diguanylate cyclase n=1 Tax=Agarivorans sp. B2Z047 TaxID=2652721 RepID=UPI00128CDAA4|nr:diguanylate cyclase [Agarivorans sp. B2Z047]MPW27589.1 diguanylate cyclase [Agarivorans sp. B2Z047]UQN44571.1 diguanylate cyclase [Agarivorans sp. B2Z047]